MSQGLSSARKRRAPQSPIPSASVCAANTMQKTVATQPQRNVTTGLTLPQVIDVLDRRLIHLETYVKSEKERGLATLPSSAGAGVAASNNNMDDIIDEFQNRFEIIAEELSSLKNIVLSLQSYTMDVNKKLIEKGSWLLDGKDLTEEEEYDEDEGVNTEKKLDEIAVAEISESIASISYFG